MSSGTLLIHNFEIFGSPGNRTIYRIRRRITLTVYDRVLKTITGYFLRITCEHNRCVEALSSMRRDAEVAPKCLLRSLVLRKKKILFEKGA